MTITEAAVTSDEQRVIDLVADLLASFPPRQTEPKVFLGEQFDRGLAWVHFPGGHGGLELSPKLQKTINERIFGAGGMLYSSYEMQRPETAMFSDSVQKAFLRSRANSIEGGTSEVMRNILGERVLGLPGDVRVDREVAWKDVPRN